MAAVSYCSGTPCGGRDVMRKLPIGAHSHHWFPGGGVRGDTSLSAAPKGRGFALFWSKNGYRLCPFWSAIGNGYRGNYGSVGI